MSRVKSTHYAGRVGEEEFGVSTVTGAGPVGHCKRPCAQCPWRSDLPTGVFPAEAFRFSANTAVDMSVHVFACHMTGTDSAATCAGFLLRSHHNLAVRIRQSKGEFDLRNVSDGGFPLYENYRAMAEANGVDSLDEALIGTR